MSRKHFLIAIVVLVVGVLGYLSIYTVHERNQALILEFGKVKGLKQKPGLHFKPPWYSVRFFDRRVLDYDARAEEVPTKDQKQLVVDAFARYRIIDPLKFFQTASTEEGWNSRLDTIINSNLRAVFGSAELATLLTKERARLISEIAKRVKAQALAFGVDVIDVRIKRLDLPQQNSEAIYRRMKTQREQEATKIRAEGDRDSKRIHAEADKRARIIRAEANKKAEILRGEGDSKAQAIYNKAYGKDRNFFDFWVSMNAMKAALGKGTTRYVGPPEGEFFRYFGNIEGKRKAPAAKK